MFWTCIDMNTVEVVPLCKNKCMVGYSCKRNYMCKSVGYVFNLCISLLLMMIWNAPGL